MKGAGDVEVHYYVILASEYQKLCLMSSTCLNDVCAGIKLITLLEKIYCVYVSNLCTWKNMFVHM
jgi:hypothetical protein